MSEFSLRKLYHPSGWAGSSGSVTGNHNCPCGCVDGYLAPPTPEARGLEGTPGMLAIEELKRRATKRAKIDAPASLSAKPWKGSAVDAGEAALPVIERRDFRGNAQGCALAACTAEHREIFGLDGRFHLREFQVRIYRHPSGAVARVRTDSKLKL